MNPNSLLLFLVTAGCTHKTERVDTGIATPSDPSTTWATRTEMPHRQIVKFDRSVGCGDELERAAGTDKDGRASGWRSLVEKMPSKLDHFCVFELEDREEAGRRGESFQALFTSREMLERGVVSVDPDHLVVYPMTATKELGSYFQARFAHEVPAVTGVLEEDQTAVELFIVDASATGTLTLSGTDHGQVMMQLATDLLCSDSQPCPVAIQNREVLRYVMTTKSRGVYDSELATTSGSIGLVSDLALELGQINAEAAEGPRVINLSVGWEPGVTLRGSNTPTTDVLMVQEAISTASCSGTLVVAAAGNMSNGQPALTGPVLPAAWAADLATCDDGSQVPMLYAAGGITREGSKATQARELVVSRSNSTPQFVAWSDHVIVTDAQGTQSLPFTGTSIASIVLSSSAAAAWANDPSLTPETLMSKLYGQTLAAETSLPIKLKAPTAAPGNAHEVSPCAAIGTSTRPYTCAAPVAEQSFPAPPSPVGTWWEIPGVPKALSFPAKQLCPTSGASISKQTPTATGGCAVFNGTDALSLGWLGPQPDPTDCPVCIVFDAGILGSPANLWLEPKHSLDGQVTLVTRSDTGSLTYYLLDNMTGTDAQILTLTDVNMANVTDAKLLLPQDGVVTVSPLYVAPGTLALP